MTLFNYNYRTIFIPTGTPSTQKQCNFNICVIIIFKLVINWAIQSVRGLIENCVLAVQLK